MTKMRRKGTGSIEVLPDGRFRPRLPGRGARLDPCATRDEAERLLAAALAEIQAGAAVDPHAMTLRAWGATVLDQRERNGIRSVATDRSRWRTHIDPWPCAAWPLRALTREDVALWRDGMLAKRVAPGNGHAATRKPRTVSRITVQNTLNLLRVVLGEAVERGLLRENPARDVRLPRAKARAHEPWTYLTPDEQQRLVAPLPGVDHVDQLAARFAVLTGLRQGEQCPSAELSQDQREPRHRGSQHPLQESLIAILNHRNRGEDRGEQHDHQRCARQEILLKRDITSSRSGHPKRTGQPRPKQNPEDERLRERPGQPGSLPKEPYELPLNQGTDGEQIAAVQSR